MTQQEHEDLHWALRRAVRVAEFHDPALALRLTSLEQKMDWAWRQSGGEVLIPSADDVPPDVRQARALDALSWLVRRWRGR